MQTMGHVLVELMISLKRIVHLWNLLRKGDQNLGTRRRKD